MALKETAVADGVQTSLTSRTVTRKADGAEFTFNTVRIVGEYTLIDARISDELQPLLPGNGKPLLAVIQFDSYRDDVQAEIVQILDAA